jgi:intracellular sulfur oxidation DsrE/DsrF family protein
MKKILLTLFIFIGAHSLMAQTDPGMQPAGAAVAGKQHKVVFQLSSEDTMVHKSLMKQLNNIITVAPGSKIEVVCHGPGLTMLTKGKTTVQEKINQLTKKNIVFVACEASMAEKNIPKEKIIPEAGFVPFAIIEIVTKQEQGWSYIKPGF